MRAVTYSILMICFVLGFTEVKAQDPQLSQYYAFQTYLNPALAGGTHNKRAMMHYRLQWPTNQSRYSTFFASYDTYLAKQKLGLGAILMSDNQASGTIKTTDLQLQASYELTVNDQWTFRPGLQLGIAQRQLSDDFRYPSQVSSTTQQYDPTQGTGENLQQSKIYPDVSAGGILYNRQFWLGLTTKHINSPNQSFIGDVSRLPLQWDIHTGIKIPLVKHEFTNYLEDVRDISISPVFNYKAQGKSDQVDLGFYLIYDQLLLGSYYRGIPWLKRYQDYQNNEAVIAMIGWNYNGLTVSYSYDITVSRLHGYTGGAHEMNLSYIIFTKHKEGHKPMKRLPCPNVHHPYHHY